MKTRIGKTINKVGEKLSVSQGAAILALDKILSHVSPSDALKLIFTPENMRAFGEGIASGVSKSAIEKVKK